MRKNDTHSGTLWKDMAANEAIGKGSNQEGTGPKCLGEEHENVFFIPLPKIF